MNFLQAASYFLREAVVGLVRSLRVSLLAILTIAVSLFLSGMVLLVSKNLSRTVHEWRAEARFVVYLAPELDADGRAALRAEIERGRWTEGLEEITPEVARVRFERAFPSLAELVAERGSGARCHPPSRRCSSPYLRPMSPASRPGWRICAAGRESRWWMPTRTGSARSRLSWR